MENFGFKIAKQNKSAFSTVGLDILFNSQKAALKIIKEGFVTIAVPSTGDPVFATIEHGLGFTPASLAYFQLSGDTAVSYLASSGDLFSGAGEGCFCDTDINTLRLGAQPNGSGAYTAYAKWYLLANRIDA